MIAGAASLYASPNPLAPYYTRFRVGERLLLTGHSHQAWPDCAERGQLRAWQDAADYVDGKWERAFERAQRVRRGFARLLDCDPAGISLGASTHELVVRWLSALPLRERPRLVTSDAEFHSLRRLLARLEQEGIAVVRVAARPAASIGERLAREVDERVAAVLVSSVFYDSAELAGGLAGVARSCERHGAALLLDVYHQLNVVPFSLRAQGLESAYVTGGGYKYCQLGEGNCFLRAPLGCALQPVITGWFAEFGALPAAGGGGGGGVSYGPLDVRFAGATYDPTSHYRACEVFDFFEQLGLDAALLREVSQHQLGVLRAEVEARALPLGLPQVPLAELAGFLALTTPRAADLQRALALRGVHADARGDVLRLGPAPYLSDEQLRQAVALLADSVRAL